MGFRICCLKKGQGPEDMRDGKWETTSLQSAVEGFGFEESKTEALI